MRLYIAGPMRGIPQFNFPAFDEAKAHLLKLGYDVVSPADLDRELGYDFGPDIQGTPDELEAIGFDYEQAMERDLAAIARVDGIALLDGWEDSSGANREVSFGRLLNLTIQPIAMFGPAPTQEILQTDPNTGGQKCQKPYRFALIPSQALKELAHVYGKGAEKYADDNWRKGYRWRWSLDAMLRHINAWQLGESYDLESGLHHLAHAAWHCFTLMTFEFEELGQDDIPERNQMLRGQHGESRQANEKVGLDQ